MSKHNNIKIDVKNARVPVEVCLKRFKRMCESAGIMKEYKKRKEFKKPSMAKKEKLAQATKRRKKEQGKMRRAFKI